VAYDDQHTYLVADFLLQRSVLLDVFALLLSRSLTLVDRRRRDAGNAVLRKVSTILTSSGIAMAGHCCRTYACHRDEVLDAKTEIFSDLVPSRA
jgi:hypothetical protein